MWNFNGARPGSGHRYECTDGRRGIDADALDDLNLLAMGHRWVTRLFKGCNKEDRPHED
ncbi:MAG: hypothetical protein JRI76_01995 [Deltaproteobacteria bacterium]|nr:hypothetical protein [Deltaproteobacteria bacterium]MBW1955046.1 hypothetical protein [Deltaproteobacteria bacterium]MBW2040780.1 hypothetical protein [Deltaproteobacteria bacterium]MBW2131184.1 hypothetical protein [Deltaproteobacteria bacterium]